MKFKSVAISLLFFVFLATGYAASPKSEAPIPVTLQDGGQGMISNGRLMLRGAGGKYAAAPAGRYVTRERKIAVVVPADGHLDAKTIAELKAEATKTTPAPRPLPTPTPSSSWGQRHQTGTHY